MKQKSGEKLRNWMKANRHSAPTFAKLLANHLKVDDFSYRTVEKWMQSKAVPRAKITKAIVAVTNGEITADSFLEMT